VRGNDGAGVLARSLLSLRQEGIRIAIWIATSGIMPAAIRPMKTIATTKRKRIRISTIGLMMKIVTTKRSIWS
jgi:hypothetical protein